jgi:hypothetical protein
MLRSRARRMVVGAVAVLVVAGLTGPASIASAQLQAPEADTVELNTVSAFGAAGQHGPAAGFPFALPVIGMAATPSGEGYWLVAADGGIFTYGDAGFFGSRGGQPLVQPIVGMAATPSGEGYWLVAADGGVFTYGDAGFFGSRGGQPLLQPIVGMAATPSGEGYWLVAADGGIFTYGDAGFFGSRGGQVLAEPVVGMAATGSGDGYWLVASDGGVFTYGDAEFVGSQGGRRLDDPVVAMAASDDGDGYWLVDRGGEIYPFGVPDLGSAAARDAEERAATVAIAAHPGGDGYWLAHGGTQVAEVDDRGPHVEALQQRLQSLGYWVGPVDGVYGRLTRQAVYAFQKANGLEVDGRVGAGTAAALDLAGRPQPRSSSGDLVEIDKTNQVLLVVRDGAVLWAFNTSTGTEQPYTYEGQTYVADTPPGRWDVYRSADGVEVSHLGRLYRPIYFHHDGIAVHGYSSVPPEPVSHGCVRVTNAAMDFIWDQNFMPIGSPVWVYGTSPGTP